jgi:hypothetical protein
MGGQTDMLRSAICFPRFLCRARTTLTLLALDKLYGNDTSDVGAHQRWLKIPGVLAASTAEGTPPRPREIGTDADSIGREVPVVVVCEPVRLMKSYNYIHQGTDKCAG